MLSVQRGAHVVAHGDTESCVIDDDDDGAAVMSYTNHRLSRYNNDTLCWYAGLAGCVQ